VGQILVKCSALNENWMPVFSSKKLLMRIDSGCETGQLFGDNTCECKEQLHKAMEMIAERGEGVIIHIPRQDGRGMGLPFKLATLTIQSRLGYDTVRAARYLKELISRKLSNVVSSKIGINCNDDIFDIRTYCGVVATLKYFEVPTTILQLATNNPEKTRLLYENGYTIEELIPVKIQPNEHTKHHLAAKQKFLGHLNLL
jgi:3,4-dihydroxy 2-butanone 4-phosphate synthase/GTP cyclohydrolase II